MNEWMNEMKWNEMNEWMNEVNEMNERNWNEERYLEIWMFKSLMIN